MKRCLLLFLCVILLASPVCAGLSVSGDTVVYVTPYGERYHKKSCSYVKKARNNGSLTEMTIQKAVERGLTPCSRCRPGKWTGTQKRLVIVAPKEPESPVQTANKTNGLFVGIAVVAGGIVILVVALYVWTRKKKSARTGGRNEPYKYRMNSMDLHYFYDALNCPAYWYAPASIYSAYMKKMNKFQSEAITGPSFVMYPYSLRFEIWYYNFAYLTLCNRLEMLGDSSYPEKYEKWITTHKARRELKKREERKQQLTESTGKLLGLLVGLPLLFLLLGLLSCLWDLFLEVVGK